MLNYITPLIFSMTAKGAAQKIISGDLVVFPTETVYGIGALAGNDEAVRKIFAVKGRPLINPLILHVADNEQLNDLVREIPETAKKLIDKYWPGPLTICLKKSNKVSDFVTAGLSTVCVRRPDHKLAQEFLREVGAAVAAPSANLSGKPSTTTFADAKKQLENRGVFFLDGGDSPLGLESTVVDCSEKRVKLLRPGCVSKEALENALGEEIFDSAEDDKISSPGQLLNHYAPSGNLTVVFGDLTKRREYFSKINFEPKKYIIGIVGGLNHLNFPAEIYQISGDEYDLGTYASRLYKFLNHCDQSGAEEIYLELPNAKNSLLPTLINRLEKSSQGNIVII